MQNIDDMRCNIRYGSFKNSEQVTNNLRKTQLKLHIHTQIRADSAYTVVYTTLSILPRCPVFQISTMLKYRLNSL